MKLLRQFLITWIAGIVRITTTVATSFLSFSMFAALLFVALLSFFMFRALLFMAALTFGFFMLWFCFFDYNNAINFWFLIFGRIWFFFAKKCMRSGIGFKKEKKSCLLSNKKNGCNKTYPKLLLRQSLLAPDLVQSMKKPEWEDWKEKIFKIYERNTVWETKIQALTMSAKSTKSKKLKCFILLDITNLK